MTEAAAAPIPQTDPGAGYHAHRAEIDAALQGVLERGSYILGSEVEAFEKEFAAYIAVEHAVGVGNGTDAIELALRACGVGSGDLVFTVSHTAVATVAAIESTGAIPVLVDIDPVTYTMDVAQLEAVLRNPPAGRPKAVIPVHLYGHPADMDAITDIARKHSLYVVEDCAQSHGARVNGRATGSIGDVATFSFYPTKNLATFGDGGMIATSNPGFAERVRLLQQYGWKERYVSDVAGRNSRLDEIHAAVLRVKLRYLDGDNERRGKLAASYNQLLAAAGLALPQVRAGVLHVYHQYAVCLEKRDALRDHLRANGIGTLVHYPVPVHLQPAYLGRIPLAGDLVQTERVASQVVSLPMYPQMQDSQAIRVADSIVQFQRGRAKRN